MATLVKVVLNLAKGEERLDDTITDRLNHVTTSAILVVMAVLVSTKQYVGDPIECWCPKEFTKNQVQYADSFCWIRGTYYVPFEREDMPSVYGRGRTPTITYYQWVPLILLVQSLLFSLPSLFWRGMQAKSGFDASNFIDYGRKVSSPKVKNDIRGTLLDHMTLQLERYLKYGNPQSEVKAGSFTISVKHLFTKTCFRFFGHRRLNYFCTLQLATKLFYLVNSVGQIFLLDYLLNMKFHTYGSDVLSSLTSGSRPSRELARHQEARFPKVTMCDFKVRRLGAVHNYSIQCALTVNLFNEKVFLILWIWMVFISAANFCSLFRWFLRNLMSGERYRYIKNLLLISGLIEPIKKKAKNREFFSPMSDSNFNNSNNINNYISKNKRTTSTDSTAKFSKYQKSVSHDMEDICEEESPTIRSSAAERRLLVVFVSHHLGPDGVLLLHLLNQATNTIVVMEMLERLWVNFRERYESICRQGRSGR